MQKELLEYIKSISVKYEAQAGAHIGIVLDKKELHITGGESVLPSIYKVTENEDLVFEQLESYFKLATEQNNLSN